MKKLEFRPITITYVRTMMLTPTSETFEDWDVEPTQESVYDWAVEEFLTTIEEEAKDGKWRNFTVITEDQSPVEVGHCVPATALLMLLDLDK